ncbi:hypothetical protein ABC766_05315 [Methylobacterium fujisawaense]|uniref:hypothetical protein n=1 Tax=Methylobacterium fujisawaense TaxID=107400 RepID=UPI0031F4819F
MTKDGFTFLAMGADRKTPIHMFAGAGRKCARQAYLPGRFDNVGIAHICPAIA